MAKQGKTLQELAIEIERQANAKRDFVAPVDQIELTDDGELALGSKPVEFKGSCVESLDRRQHFDLNPLAHSHLAEFTSIPKVYYDRLLKNDPALLAQNVNRWLPEIRENGKAPTPRLVRVLDGHVRAVLSNSYRHLENYDLAQAILPVLADLQLTIVSCEITERNLFIKAFDSGIEREIRRAGSDPAHTFLRDVCFPAIGIRNSEVGCGAWEIACSVYTGGCTNFAIFGDSALRKYHSGAKLGSNEGLTELFSDKTKLLTDEATLAQARDVCRAAFDIARFESKIALLQDARAQPIGGDVVKVVELAGRDLGFTKEEGSSILKHLISGGDLSRYGLHSAITRAAQDVTSYDRASELERDGARVIELPRQQWERLAQAA